MLGDGAIELYTYSSGRRNSQSETSVATTRFFALDPSCPSTTPGFGSPRTGGAERRNQIEGGQRQVEKNIGEKEKNIGGKKEKKGGIAEKEKKRKEVKMQAGRSTLGRSLTLNRPSPTPPAGPTFYVDLATPDSTVKESMEGANVQPDLLPDEQVICQADRVVTYSTGMGGMTSGHTGCLFVTTLRLSLQLHTATTTSKERGNKLLGEQDVTLSSIEAVYEVQGEAGDRESRGERRKKLPLGSTVANRVEAIFVLCKNFKFLRLSFKFAGVDCGRKITNALLHHSRPKKSELLFAFDRLTTSDERNGVGGGGREVGGNTDWEEIVRESESSAVRVSRANETWQVATSLPRQFAVPAHVTDDKLAGVAGLGLGTRPPVWVWGTKGGGNLFIQPQSNVLESDEVKQQYRDFYHRDQKGERNTINLDETFSHPLEEAFVGMLELHCLETEKEADEKDTKYLTSLEATGWMSAVGAALRIARDVAERVQQGKLVVLIEGEGRSSSPMVASLAMILLSEEFRTRRGWQKLVQANWVSLGFPFSRHHTLANPTSKPSSLNPMFLLFLDCVHQVHHQFPSMMEFLPSFLIHVWDSALTPVFHTFLFDCDHDRALALQAPDCPPARYSVWAWETQFTPEQIASWDNPLYGVPMRPPRRSAAEPSEFSQLMERQPQPIFPETRRLLQPSGAIVNLDVWHELFHRSVSFLQPDPSPFSSVQKVRREAKEQVSRLSATTFKGPNNRSH